MADNNRAAKTKPDRLATPAKKGQVELRETDLDKVAGGAPTVSDITITKTYDKSSP